MEMSSVGERIAHTLLFLASAGSQLPFTYRLGMATVDGIIPEICDAMKILYPAI